MKLLVKSFKCLYAFRTDSCYNGYQKRLPIKNVETRLSDFKPRSESETLLVVPIPLPENKKLKCPLNILKY